MPSLTIEITPSPPYPSSATFADRALDLAGALSIVSAGGLVATSVWVAVVTLVFHGEQVKARATTLILAQILVWKACCPFGALFSRNFLGNPSLPAALTVVTLMELHAQHSWAIVSIVAIAAHVAVMDALPGTVALSSPPDEPDLYGVRPPRMALSVSDAGLRFAFVLSAVLAVGASGALVASLKDDGESGPVAVAVQVLLGWAVLGSAATLVAAGAVAFKRSTTWTVAVLVVTVGAVAGCVTFWALLGSQTPEACALVCLFVVWAASVVLS